MPACRVRVPGSSANLGPGFDSFAAAVSLHLEVEVVKTGSFAVKTDLPIATDRRNLVVRGFAALLPADEWEFTIRSEIPTSGGLGTSAAAYVAGLVAANYLSGGGADLLTLATELEGHPDNVAASLLGGLVVCADGMATRLGDAIRPGGGARRPQGAGPHARGARRAAVGGADRRRGVQRRTRGAADRRTGEGRPRPRRARTR